MLMVLRVLAPDLRVLAGSYFPGPQKLLAAIEAKEAECRALREKAEPPTARRATGGGQGSDRTTEAALAQAR